jgi:hypothetical protein
MMRARSVVIGLLVLSSTATVARAQMGGGMSCSRIICPILSGGLTVPAADMADLHDSGFHYDVSLLLNIPGFPIVIRPEFSLTQFQLKNPLGSGGYSGEDMTKMYMAMGNIELPLAGGLYAIAGGGMMSLSVPGAAPGGSTTDESEAKFTFDAGAGYRFKMGGIRGFLEARVGAASYEAGVFGFEKAQFIPITFGFVF